MAPPNLKRTVYRRFPKFSARARKVIRRLLPPPEVAPDADQTLHRELRTLGPEYAKEVYAGERRRRDLATAAYKLARTYSLTGEAETAAQVLDSSVLRGARARLLKLEYLANAGVATDQLTALVPRKPKRQVLRALSLLGKSVVDDQSLAVFLDTARQLPPSVQEDAGYLVRLGNAARRGGRPEVAVEYLEEALRRVPPGQAIATIRSVPMTDPWLVLRDLLEVAGPAHEQLFPVAGTLLGFVREQGFISHDYDMDFGIRDDEAHAALRDAMRHDWRFDVLPGREAGVLKATHINGTAIDLYLFRREGAHWLQQTHVYGWRFRDFELAPVQIQGIDLRMPTDSDGFLEQMYGPDWRTPQPGFDSRLYAPNCFFPSRLELICALLIKSVTAVRAGQWGQLETYRRFLAERFEYELPAITDGAGDRATISEQ